MNRMILAAGFAAIAIFFAGCGEECGPQCPPEISESPPAVDVLVVTGFAFPGMARLFHDPLVDCGVLPEGSAVDTFSLLDGSRALVIPTIEYLQQYDALLVFTDSWPEGHGTHETYAYDTIGALLADYVDSGGGLVMCQFAISGYAAGIRGRIVDPGYAPLTLGGWEMLSEEIDRSIVLESLEFPLHPVFTGVDIEQVRLCSVPSGIGRPALDESAVLLAIDDMGTNAVAVNSSGNIVGINTYYKSFALPEQYSETVRLVANSLVFVSGVQLE